MRQVRNNNAHTHNWVVVEKNTNYTDGMKEMEGDFLLEIPL